MSSDPINNRVIKSDLLLAGWHSIYRGDTNKEVWAHPILIGDHPLKLAKKLHLFLRDDGIYDKWERGQI